MHSMEFSARLIGPGTWAVTGAGCDCYLVEGDKEAIMVDAGQPRTDIRAFAQGLTDKPLRRVVNTHSHFDHTGGNGWFDEALISRKAAPSARTVMDANAAQYKLDYPMAYVEDGDSIDLGGRRLRVLMLDCHSPGSLALLDERERLLFCGDEVDSGQVLLLPGYAERKGQIHSAPAGAVETCLQAMRRMQAEQAHFDALCPAHNGAPIAPVYLDWFITLCEEILQGKQGTADCTSPSYSAEASHYPYPNAGYLRASYKGASLVYQQTLLREADRAHADALPPATPLHVMCAADVWQGWA